MAKKSKKQLKAQQSMLSKIALVLGVILLLLLGYVAIKEHREADYLGVISASSGEVSAKSLTISGISQDPIMFSDRPERNAAQVSVDEFVALWDEKSFRKDPPNAAVTFTGESGTKTVVVTIKDATVTDDGVMFKFSTIRSDEDFNGELENITIFIDPDTVSPIITDAVTQT